MGYQHRQGGKAGECCHLYRLRKAANQTQSGRLALRRTPLSLGQSRRSLHAQHGTE